MGKFSSIPIQEYSDSESVHGDPMDASVCSDASFDRIPGFEAEPRSFGISEDPRSYDPVEANSKIAALKAELQEKTELVTQLKEDLKRSEEKYDELSKKHKAVGRKFLTAKPQMVGFHQISDARLTSKVRILRDSICNFGLDSFRDCQIKWPERYMADHNLPVLGFIRSWKTITPSDMEMYTWHILDRKIFGKFVWAGRDSGLPEAWRNIKGQQCNDQAGALRKALTWRATTSCLILGSVESQDHISSNLEEERLIENDIDRLVCKWYPKAFTPDFTKEHQTAYDDRIFDIVRQAVKLDSEICMQAALITWDFGSLSPSSCQETQSSLHDTEVLAPGVIKKGKTNGDDLDKEPQVLLERKEVRVKKFVGQSAHECRGRDLYSYV